MQIVHLGVGVWTQGLLIQLMKLLFKHLEERNMVCKVGLSYWELRQNEVTDLLRVSEANTVRAYASFINLLLWEHFQK